MIHRRTVIQGLAGGCLLPLAGVFSDVLAQGSSPSTATQATLGVIRAVTQTADSLPPVEQAWTRFMGYKLITRGKISESTARGWNAPALAGKPYIILGPQNGERTYIRFVEQPTPQGYDAEGTYGWRTIEITVQNSDELYERLKDSPFIVRGPPRTVPTYSYLKALGARGPAGERLALTWITEKRPDLAVAESFVGRCFIATQMSPDLPASLEWFKSTFGNVASPIRQLPSMQLSVVTLKEGAKLEIDQHGPSGRVREPVSGGLPPGLAIVTMDCSSFARHEKNFIAPAVKNDMEPFAGKNVATMKGMAGELIELIDA